MGTDPDKITILLIDDDPGTLHMKRESDGVIVPCVCGPPVELDEHFELLWIATAEEAREFRDLCLAISVLSPEDISAIGCLPEIISVDYRLSLTPVPVDERSPKGVRLPPEVVREISPLPRLREKAAELGVEMPVLRPVEASTRADDNMGCFAGGLIYSLFSAHPCGIVAQTRHGNPSRGGLSDKTEGTEARYFETLLEYETGGALRARYVQWPTWDKLVPLAVRSLRARIQTLHKARMVTLSLDDLFAIADRKDQDTLGIQSRYGFRRLPLAGLFMDVDAGDNRRDKVAEWAEQLLRDILSDLIDTKTKGAQQVDYPSLRAAVQQGQRLSEALWKQYTSDRLAKRYLLSRLCARKRTHALPGYYEQLLKELADEFGVNLDSKTPRCADGRWCDIRMDEFGPYAQRFAALFTAVRLEAQRRLATRATSRVGLGELRREDVYLALFPVPMAPLIVPYWHDSSKDFTQSWARVLTRLDDPAVLPASLRSDGGDNWGNLALRIEDVLRGKPWSEDATASWSVQAALELERPSDLTAVVAKLEQAVGITSVKADRDSTPNGVKLQLKFRKDVCSMSDVAEMLKQVGARVKRMDNKPRIPQSWSYGLRIGERRLLASYFSGRVRDTAPSSSLGLKDCALPVPAWLSRIDAPEDL